MLHSMITHSHFLSHLCTHSHSPPPPAVTLVVFTMNHGESFQMKFDSGRFTTVAQITEIMLKQLGIAAENANVFSLWLTSKHLRRWLPSLACLSSLGQSLCEGEVCQARLICSSVVDCM